MCAHPLVFVTWVIPVSVTFMSVPLSGCVNSLGYSVCLSPAKSLRIDQVGMQNLREEVGLWEKEREGEEKSWRGWLWFNLNWLDKQGGEKQNKL